MKLAKLTTITEPKPVNELTKDQLMELQTALSLLGFPLGDIDGLIGPKTRNAWAEFKTDIFPGNADLIEPNSIETLQEKVKSFGQVGIYNFSTKAGTIEAIKAECKVQGIGLNTQIAYVLATTQWETAQTFKPVKEAFWLSEDWRRNNFKYFPYYGRGFVQLTWKKNYEAYGKILRIDLVNNRDLALDPNVALFVLVHGFKTGTFTNRKITDYITDDKTDFINARRCINGKDKAHEIADLANRFLKDL